MQNQTYTTTDSVLTHHHSEKRYSFTPVLIGGLIGLGLGFLMDLFSISMGLSLFTTDPAGAKMLVTSGMIGMLIGTILTMYVTGFCAGYLATHSYRKYMGMIYGFAAWCLSLVLLISLGTAIGNYMNNYSGSITHPRATTAKSQVQFTLHENAKSVNDMVNPSITAETTGAEEDAKAAGMQSFVIYVLFLAGAIAATFGGHVGYRCWAKCRTHHHHV